MTSGSIAFGSCHSRSRFTKAIGDLEQHSRSEQKTAQQPIVPLETGDPGAHVNEERAIGTGLHQPRPGRVDKPDHDRPANAVHQASRARGAS